MGILWFVLSFQRFQCISSFPLFLHLTCDLENCLEFSMSSEGEFFSWLLLHNKVLTGDNILKCGFNGPFQCFFCKSALETDDHLLIDCAFSKLVWELVLHSSNFSIPIHNTINSFYLSWHDQHPQKYDSVIWHKHWHSILKYTWWSLWIAGNNYIFNDQIPIS